MTAKRFKEIYPDIIRSNYCFTDNGEPIGDKEVCDLLNELHEENQIKLEIIDSFIRGLEDEKGIDPENVEFQCRMNFTIKVLKKLKKDMLEPTEFKRLKELIE